MRSNRDTRQKRRFQRPPSVQAIVDSAMSRVRTDTTSAAYKQLNLMTAPVDVIPLNAFEQGTLEWVTREDSCAIVVRSHGPTATQSPSGGSGQRNTPARGARANRRMLLRPPTSRIWPSECGFDWIAIDPKTQKRVGRGVPVAATRNGQYLAAVRREKGRPQAVLYAFRLFHAAMKTSCDAP